MMTMSGSRAEPSSAAATPRGVLVWDLPVRVFHWLMVACFAGAWLSSESERWRLLHVTLGYTMAALVLFRLVWGLIGTRHARFSSFVRGPAAVMRYLWSLLRGQPEHHTGHNPAGAWAIVGLLLLTLAVTASGWAHYNDLGGGWLGGDGLEDLHEGAANAMLLLVGVHVAGVVVGSWLHRENLVRSMVTGVKQAPPQDAVRSAWRSVGVLMLVAVLGFWWLQWRDAPGGGVLSERSPGGMSSRETHSDDDDD